MLRLFVLTFALLLAMPAAAQAPRFTALCTHEGGQRVDASERNRRGVWSDDEKYDPKPWVVQFNGADKLTVDGEEFIGTARSATTIMGVTHHRAPGADNAKIWVLNIGLGRGFFSHLQGIDLLGERIVGKLHEFRCQVTRY
jgi:hypothetical protein